MSSDHIFKLPSFGSSTDTWGPPSSVPEYLRFNDVPYAPYSKSDKLGKLSDWADPNKVTNDNKRPARNHRDPYHAYGASAAASFFNTEETADSGSFSVVDNSKAPKARQTTVIKAKGGRNNATPLRNNGRPVAGGARSQAPQSKTTPAAGRRKFGWKEERPQKNRDASVKIADTWKLIQSNQFNELQKLSFDVKPGADVAKYGYALPYNRNLDKPGATKVLPHVERAIYNTTTSDDPVIQKLAASEVATVFATDSIISLLMCSTKSVYPWDIIINKSEGKIFLDKRDDGPLDYVTVDENTYDPPSDGADASTNINSATNLSIEATYINQNFAANAVTGTPRVKFENTNPFASEDDNAPPLPTAYRYRKFNLAEPNDEEPINLVIRTEVDAYVPGKPDQYITIKALNEYAPNGVLEWRQKFNNQRGAIVAAEMKKNLNKLSRWTVESILSGAANIKIGFVSRQTPKDNSKHSIVGVVSQIPTQFASQINLKIANGWGIVKSIVNIVAALDDGKYVLMKDPNAPIIKIYSVPLNTFEEEDNDEE